MVVITSFAGNKSHFLDDVIPVLIGNIHRVSKNSMRNIKQ
jgi:hypothetical protein